MCVINNKGERNLRRRRGENVRNGMSEKMC